MESEPREKKANWMKSRFKLIETTTSSSNNK